MCIDHSGCDHTVADIDHRSVGVTGEHVRGRSDANDQLVVDGNGTAEQHLAPLVHGDHFAAGEQQHQVKPRTKGCARAWGGRTLVAKTDMTTIVATNGSEASRSEFSS